MFVCLFVFKLCTLSLAVREKLTVAVQNGLSAFRSSEPTTLAIWRPRMSTSEYASKKYSNTTWKSKLSSRCEYLSGKTIRCRVAKRGCLTSSVRRRGANGTQRLRLRSAGVAGVAGGLSRSALMSHRRRRSTETRLSGK